MRAFPNRVSFLRYPEFMAKHEMKLFFDEGTGKWIAQGTDALFSADDVDGLLAQVKEHLNEAASTSSEEEPYDWGQNGIPRGIPSRWDPVTGQFGYSEEIPSLEGIEADHQIRLYFDRKHRVWSADAQGFSAQAGGLSSTLLHLYRVAKLVLPDAELNPPLEVDPPFEGELAALGQSPSKAS